MIKAGIDLGSQPGQLRRPSVQNGTGERRHIFLGERAMPGECFIAHDADRIKIISDTRRCTGESLGTQVSDGAEDVAR